MALLVVWVISMRKWDNPYHRAIVGDAKGYYAYLPAVFIYQDLTFDFVHDMEAKYYPADGSLWKDFLVEQPNGTSVNKCFPGVAFFYLPFFLLAYFLSFLFGLPLDGYSVLFQWSIVAAHVFYFVAALFLLNKVLRAYGVSTKNRLITFFALTFGTNLLYYLVFDVSLVHVFGFFGTSFIIYLLYRWNIEKRWSYLGGVLALMSLLVIMRPTNAMLVLLFPLLVNLRDLWNFIRSNFNLKSIPYIYVLISAMVLITPLVLWKLQTGNWLVYSYGDEKMDLLKPNLFPFLFSVLKGWWFWSPIIFLMYFGGIIFFYQKNKFSGIYFAFHILIIAYVFSSWWIWTYGGGMGQRPMIDFYPILVIGFAGFLQSRSWSKWINLLIIPLMMINMVQAFQINKYILIGGETTWLDYKNSFLQLKRSAPSVVVDDTWLLIDSYKTKEISILNQQTNYSETVVIDELPDNATLVVTLNISGKHESEYVALVLSDENGAYYHAHYLGNYLYRQSRWMSFEFIVPPKVQKPLRVYIWNSDTNEEVQVQEIRVDVYSTTINSMER